MNYKKSLQNRVFRAIEKVADTRGERAFVIGGFVRDLILDRPSKDIDVVTEGKGIDLARAVAKELGIRQVSVFKNFGTAMFVCGDLEVEFVGARKESYSRGSRKPVVEDGTLEDDQNRRDFTINAMALSLSSKNFGELIDPFNGMRDLDMGLIRTPLDPDITFSDDPLRMMRAVRFATQLDFTIVPESLAALKRNAERLDIISMERIHTELNKIILANRPGIGFRLLEKANLLVRFFPEMTALKGIDTRNGISHKDNFIHTIQVLENVCDKSDDLWLRWAAILHDIAKPPTKRFDKRNGWTFHGHEDRGARMVPKIFSRLKLPMDAKMKFVQKLVLLHLRPIALTKEVVTDSAIRRLLCEAGDDIDALMILCRADITSKNEAKVSRYLKNYDIVVKKLKEVEENDSIRNFQPPVTGEMIMKTFGIPPSRPIGDIKKAIKEAILDGDIKNDPEEAFELMLKLGGDMGLKRV
ncbi:MAG TPA: HD domain-containing protein [Flavobacteriales bacterium]|nr:HD domain-containing protein [Flavobacteriales bacterium]HIO60177.1 HD domain-containing protein [Flavobacteriales bacterium]